MFSDFPLFPEQASTIAQGIDLLYYFLVATSGFFSVLIFCLIFYFAIRYRQRGGVRRIPERLGRKAVALEVAWSVIPLVLVMVMFTWGASLFFSNSRVPRGAMEISVVGKQWMWKVQHPEGRREINELHVPVGQPVKLTLASEDVIHSFYVPAFRVKQDVVPGRFQTMWFEATRTGEYHLFCAEYCGTQHSGMGGKVVVMEPDDFQRWLGGETGATPVEEGARLFTEFNCVNCHRGNRRRGPQLEGQFGQLVELRGGEQVLFDENYVRQSIISPNSQVVAGFEPVMPTYRGQVGEEQLLQLIAYIRSLTDAPVMPGGGANPTAPPDPETPQNR